VRQRFGFRSEAGLAHTGLTQQEDHPTGAGRRPLDGVGEDVEMAGPADQDRAPDLSHSPSMSPGT
jgi:hypothetical protein